MRILVTGAGGFLGSQVVMELVDRGHGVIGLVRPGTNLRELPWFDKVEARELDLRSPQEALAALLRQVDTVVHLAARVAGSDADRFSSTVIATENLLWAMRGSGVRRIVLASSYSVYDWDFEQSSMTEGSPILKRPYGRDGYTVAKVWQERLVREAADAQDVELVVLRPGFIWDESHAAIDGVGVPLGRLLLVVGPRSSPPLTHVKNCAVAFALAAEVPRAAGRTYNIVDGSGLTSWRFAREHYVASRPSLSVPVPYAAAHAAVGAAYGVARALLGPHVKLPSVLMPVRFRARFRPFKHGYSRARAELGWKPMRRVTARSDSTTDARWTRNRHAGPVK